jgi:hypothetical protein
MLSSLARLALDGRARLVSFLAICSRASRNQSLFADDPPTSFPGAVVSPQEGASALEPRAVQIRTRVQRILHLIQR